MLLEVLLVVWLEVRLEVLEECHHHHKIHKMHQIMNNMISNLEKKLVFTEWIMMLIGFIVMIISNSILSVRKDNLCHIEMLLKKQCKFVILLWVVDSFIIVLKVANKSLVFI